MPRVTEQKRDEVIEAADHGMTFSGQSYQVRNLGDIYIATDRRRDSFSSNEEYVRYVYENRHDRDKVRFINEEQNNLYKATRYQDRIAVEIARQAGVEVSAPPTSFPEEARRAEQAAEQPQETVTRENVEVREQQREETAIFRVSFWGRPVRFEMDVSNLSELDREWLRGSIDSLARANASNMEDTFSTFIDNFKDRMRGLSMEFTTENLDRYWGAVPYGNMTGAEVVAQMRSLIGRV
ncbi:MAG: hypothetical protein PHQ80_01225 [Candidatus ainarchaeum sp.]|nr:hypothetical protein [Candidatus ainarchaeum sp.]